ncbi:MAG: hypothetical protein CMF62_02510 [Magnetococcales bacterium]|nr:hypothetical protein [Magnetococcales bacterium]
MPHIYLIKEREFIKTDENIFKLGKTTQKKNKRFYSYPKGSILYFQIYSDNISKIEKKLIELFKKNFTHAIKYGNEYFEGDNIKMQKIIADNIILDKIDNKVNSTCEHDLISEDSNDSRIIKDLTYFNENNEEFTLYHYPLSRLDNCMVKFLKSNEKIQIEQIPLICNLYHNRGKRETVLPFIKEYFKDFHYSYIDIENMFKDTDINTIHAYKYMYPKLNLLDIIFSKCQNMNDFNQYANKAYLDQSPISQFFNLNKKERIKIITNQKYKFIDMASIKGKLSKEKLNYLSQNKNLTDKIKQKYNI